MTVFRTIAVGSPDYGRELALRDAVLRKPLGLSLGPVDLEKEQGEYHFGLFDEAGVLLACAIGSPLSATEARIRQVAVAADRQGRGLGRRLMLEAEAALAAKGFTRLELHARVSVEGFYRKLGYAPVGQEFLEVSLPHIAMVKSVKPA